MTMNPSLLFNIRKRIVNGVLDELKTDQTTLQHIEWVMNHPKGKPAICAQCQRFDEENELVESSDEFRSLREPNLYCDNCAYYCGIHDVWYLDKKNHGDCEFSNNDDDDDDKRGNNN